VSVEWVLVIVPEQTWSCEAGSSADGARAAVRARGLRFRDDEGALLYVGRAAQLRTGVTSCFSDLRDRRHLKPMVAAVANIEVVVCGSRHEAAWLERNILVAGLPPWNRTAGGQETPVVITLDRRRPSPGLRLKHLPLVSIDEGVRIFGPYLGGLQVRRAVAGLHRIFPLAYAGTRLTGAERPMADEHGVSERDRGLLAEKLAAILERDSDAVSRSRAEPSSRTGGGALWQRRRSSSPAASTRS